ncbi:MarR family winged helix-turn-helix transcriptional regulator [Microbacterium sp. SSW1-59]|uniref:MarR family winged helix-turn-helix transcriptional regulator n=1 Tax=Microbacterium xanthum TaxID=3079794 RepID=UPI002AD1E69D|nr:MarR family winged helix-turn-helix transcriptional regulator [Microbacterium sp. SSW1-59]MDZ8200078.1 MarR family winged helix-turn-helix transcriptional regulator [Microbacterium sp. SSW1-59]
MSEPADTEPNPSGGAADPHVVATRALEAEFGELIARFRHVIAEQADRVSPGMLPGAYKTFTTITRMAPVSSSALAEALLADKAQVSRTVRDLEALGLIQRSPDSDDRRVSLLSPTAEGLRRLEAARDPQRNSLMRRMSTWDLDDIRTLTRLLRALRDDSTAP